MVMLIVGAELSCSGNVGGWRDVGCVQIETRQVDVDGSRIPETVLTGLTFAIPVQRIPSDGVEMNRTDAGEMNNM